ncbi:MAG: GNAT family N-acetyltransferase [Ruminococcaceae bacterium]|nr:GNAT family N-acetyltransferase [Oscillospiraceae bacterium]
MIDLKKADRSDCETIHRIQVKAFSPILLKYQDYDSNPASESLDDIYRRFDQSFTDYYLIELDGSVIGALRVCDFGAACKLSPICILPEFQGNGYAQKAIRLMEDLYPKAGLWELDTIAQEEKLCYLYEKIGYRKTGRVDHLKDGMDIVYYEKSM